MPKHVVQPGEFTIAGHQLTPGTCTDHAIPVTTMATGYDSVLAIRALHGTRPGPVVFVSGAIHGDEIIGTAIVQRLAQELDAGEIAGTLLLIPVANIFGFLNKSRYLPDRRDLNRSFPGNDTGSLAGQFAHAFFSEVVERASLGIDIHSAAVHRYNLPQIRIAPGNQRLSELASAFGAPIIIESPLREGSLRALAGELGVEMLLMETGEALRFDRLSIETGVAGVKRVLAHIGMIESDTALPDLTPSARASRSGWVRSPRGGVTHRLHKSGDPVRQGDILATVTGLFGEDAQEVVCPFDGIVIGHATLPVVHQGDALFHIARIDSPEHAGQRIDTITEAMLSFEAEDMLLDEDEII